MVYFLSVGLGAEQMRKASIEDSFRFEPWNLPPRENETQSELQQRRSKAYFDWQRQFSNAHFWERIGHVDLRGKRILELGCGHGALAVEMAEKGAASVHGLDLEPQFIDFANRNLSTGHPDISDRVSFAVKRIEDIEGTFDMLVSKDTFEHLAAPQSAVDAAHRLLRPGGELVVGFSPLFYSPFGDHNQFTGKRTLPWLPAFVPLPILLKMASKRTGLSIKSLEDVGLNGLTPRGFHSLFSPDRWRIERLAHNQGRGRGMRVFSALRRLPLIEKYFTINIYAVVRRI